jgi:4a-hydroxytetrahydrobiopterin dehydratase
MALYQKRCVPCSGATPKLTARAAADLRRHTRKWQIVDEKLLRTFAFDSFPRAIEFVNRMAALAESEGHHPVFTVRFNEVDVTLWTHKIDGLSENDFILASKLDGIGGA